MVDKTPAHRTTEQPAVKCESTILGKAPKPPVVQSIPEPKQHK